MKPVGNDRGISLLEVLASITLFSVVAASLSATTIGTIKFNAASKDTAAASALVHDKVERFRTLNPAANPADLTPGTHSDALNPMTPLGKTGGRFSRVWTVTPNTPRIGLSLVVVTVTWNGPESRSVSGSTYVCRTETCS
jgi:Tfp pilus assembly protein PilV